MKSTAMIVNCARGGIDCFENDPHAADDPLLNAKNVIASPHSAAHTKEAVIWMHKMSVRGDVMIMFS